MNFFQRIIPQSYVNEEEKQSELRFLRAILIVTIVGVVAITLSDGVMGGRWYLVYALTPLALLLVGTTILLARGIIQPAKFLVPVSIFAVLVYTITVGGGIHDIAMVAFASLLVISALTLGRNAALIFGALTSIYVFILGLLEINQVITNEGSFITTIDELVLYSILILLTATLLRILISRLNDSITSARNNEQAQIHANTELRNLQATLEQRVEERTTELIEANQRNEQRAAQFSAIAQIGRIISSVQDPETLLPKVTGLISDQLSFYHVGIFLNDDENRFAILQASNSEGGQRMLKRGHRLEIGKMGIVGYVANTGAPRIALDTGTDAIFFDNPDLPATRSEMALPLKVGSRIIGVLDVQSIEANAFHQEDIETLSVLADQLSIAIENTRLFEETRRALNTAQETYQRYFGQSWNQFIRQAGYKAYLFDKGKVTPLDKTKGKSGFSATNSLSIPLMVRGQVIGVLDIKPEVNDRQLSENEISLAKAAAERAALALENARLLNDAQRRASREQTIGEISAKLGTASQVEAIMRTAVEELGRQIPGASDVSIKISDIEIADTLAPDTKEN